MGSTGVRFFASMNKMNGMSRMFGLPGFRRGILGGTGEAARPLIGDARRAVCTEDDGAAHGWVAAEAGAVGTVQRMVSILAVQSLARYVVKFAQGGDGGRGRWRGRLGRGLSDYLVEGRRVGMLGDGVIEIVG